jgi:hypothetical protein
MFTDFYSIFPASNSFLANSPVVREYLRSEAMPNPGVKSTRSDWSSLYTSHVALMSLASFWWCVLPSAACQIFPMSISHAPCIFTRVLHRSERESSITIGCDSPYFMADDSIDKNQQKASSNHELQKQATRLCKAGQLKGRLRRVRPSTTDSNFITAERNVRGALLTD